MEMKKFILACVTTNREKIPSGVTVFHCESKEEMESISASLEAILDGIAHALTEEIMIIVKH